MNIHDSKTSQLIVLKRGEELHDCLKRYAKENDLTSAWVQVLGGASSVRLGYYDLPTRTYQMQDFDEMLEIVTITGNMSIVDDEPFFHLHGTFSRADYSVIAGHVDQCVIGLTGEIHLQPLDIAITRTFDDETGLKLLSAE